MEENKTVFVTGASRGIGKEVALKFADTGIMLLLTMFQAKQM